MKKRQVNFRASDDLFVELSIAARKFGVTRQGFVEAVLRQLFGLPSPVSTWAASKIGEPK